MAIATIINKNNKLSNNIKIWQEFLCVRARVCVYVCVCVCV